MIKSNFKFFWNCWERGIENDGANDGIPLMTVEQRQRLNNLNGYSELRREENTEDPPVCSWVTQAGSGQGSINFDITTWMNENGYTPFTVDGVEIGVDPFSEALPALTALSLNARTTDDTPIRNLVTTDNPIPEEAWTADPIHFTSVSHIVNTYGWSQNVEGYYQLDFEGFPENIVTEVSNSSGDYKFLSDPNCPPELKTKFKNALSELIRINIFKIKEYFPNLKITNYAWPRIGPNSVSGGRVWGNGTGDYDQTELNWLEEKVLQYKDFCEHFDFLSPFARPFYDTINSKLREYAYKRTAVKFAKMLRDSYGKTNRQLPIYPSTATYYHQSRMMGWSSYNPMGMFDYYTDFVAAGQFGNSFVSESANVFHEGQFTWQYFAGNVLLPVSDKQIENDGTIYHKVNFIDEVLQPMLDEGADGIWLYHGWGFPQIGGSEVIPQNQQTGDLAGIYRWYMSCYSYQLHTKIDIPYFKYMMDEYYSNYGQPDGSPLEYLTVFRQNTGSMPLLPSEIKYKNFYYDLDANSRESKILKLHEIFRDKMYQFASKTRSVSTKHKIKNIVRASTISRLREAINKKKIITDTSISPPIAI